ncbi:MAG: phosphoribosyltransferase family protein [Kiritimatiellia bacterium]
MDETTRIFQDRADAGERLGEALIQYRDSGAIVLGIPRGGVEVGFVVAEALDAVFSVLVVHKLPFLDNAEAGFGAVAEDGSVFFMPQYRSVLHPVEVKRIIREQEAEVIRRVKKFRPEQPMPDLAGRHVIVVDDGIAMGSTTRAAVMCCRNKGAGKVTVAAPVASPDAVRLLREAADELVVLLVPPFFQAVAEFYEDWHDCTDQEAMKWVNRVRAGAGVSRWPAG